MPRSRQRLRDRKMVQTDILNAETTPSGKESRVVELLQSQAQPLFAILDAAQNDRILELLRDSGETYQSLYEGKAALDLVNFAPYLVQLPKDSALLRNLVAEGWDKNWGIYLTSEAPFQEVRRHFRNFIIVETEEGKELYFRFYDPRVLRAFLPTCSLEELNQIYGPVTAYIVINERKDIDILNYDRVCMFRDKQ